MSSGPLVLVGTDGSYTSFKAVEKAAALAAEKGGSLLIISAYVEHHGNDSAAEEEMGDLAYQMRGSNPAEAAVQEASDHARKVDGEIEIETQIDKGEPLQVLGKIAKEKGAEIVVVGNVGRRGLAGRITGSVPEGIKRHITDAEVVVVETGDS